MILTSFLNSILLLILLIYLVWSIISEPDPTKPAIKTFKSIVSLKEKPKIPKVEDELPAEFTNIEKGPFIGVLTMPCPVVDHIPGTAVIPGSYIKWLESAGAVVVPIPFHISKKRLEILFKNLNGLVITGGRALLWKEVKDEELIIEKEDDSNLNPENKTVGAGDDNGDEKTVSDDSQNDNSTFADSEYNSTVEIEANTTKPKRFRRTRFAKSISHFIKLALKGTIKGDYFPILGICLGMEGIILHFERTLSNPKYLRKVNLTRRDYIEGVGTFTKAAPGSKLYKNFKGKLQDLTQRVFYYHHQYGIDYDNVINKFEGGIEPLSYFHDNNKKKYVTSFEFTNHPIFGIQFHPEKAAYEWKVKMNRSQTAQKVSADIAYNFVQECKKNNHTFNMSRFQNLISYNFDTTNHSSIYNQIYKLPYRFHNKFKYFIKTKNSEKSSLVNETNFNATTIIDTNLNPEMPIVDEIQAPQQDVNIVDNQDQPIDVPPVDNPEPVDENIQNPDIAQSDGAIGDIDGLPVDEPINDNVNIVPDGN